MRGFCDWCVRHKRESLDWFIAFVMGRYDWISKRRTCITKLRKSHKAPAPAVVAPTVDGALEVVFGSLLAWKLAIGTARRRLRPWTQV